MARWSILALIALACVGLCGWLAWTPDADPAELRQTYGRPPSSYIGLTNGQRIHLRDRGPRTALPVLLLHGTGGSLHNWEGWAERLKGGFRVITIDLPGHGLSGPASGGDYSAAAADAVVSGVAQALGLGHFVIGGNGRGGELAWRYALAHPDRIDGLLLVSATGGPETDGGPKGEIPLAFSLARSSLTAPLMAHLTPRWMVARALKLSVCDPAKVSDALIDRHWALLRYPGNRPALIAALKAQKLEKPEAVSPLDRIVTPTLIQWGEKDRRLPMQAATAFRSRIPASELVIYPDVGHLLMLEAPEQTVADVITFLGLIQMRQPAPPGALPPPVSDAAPDPAVTGGR